MRLENQQRKGSIKMAKKWEKLVFLSVLLLIFSITINSPLASADSFADSDKQIQEYIQDLETALYTLQEYYVDEVELDKLFKGAMGGLFAALDDPYSLYLDDDYLRSINDTTKGKYGGVGLYIVKESFDPENPYGQLPYVKVVSPIEDTPSWKAGINPGDYIYAIEGESAKDYDTRDVANKLRGRAGTSVTVTILRGENLTFDVRLTRKNIEIPTVKKTVIDNTIGYLRIIEFTPYSVPRVKEAIEEFKKENLDKLIIDVRSNPGGLLESVVKISDFFFSGGVVVSTRYRQEDQNQVHRASRRKIVSDDIEIAVLIDNGSASASEILTGALKDRNRATVIGQTSFGKGSVQQLLPYRDKNAAIKLTTGRYFTPSGNNIDKTGIEPHILVEKTELTDDQTEDLALILKEKRVANFIDEVPNPTKYQIDQFINALRAEELDPGERSLRVMIKREQNNLLKIPPVVDLDYDKALLRAIKFLKTGR